MTKQHDGRLRVSYECRGGDRSVGLDIGRNGYSSC